MESFREYIEGLKKEKEEKLEEDIIDEISEKVVKKIQEKTHPVVPYCFNCPYYFYYPHCPSCAYHIYPVWTYPVPANVPISTHTYNSWRHGEGEKDE